jgi:hypothetical protein
MRDMRKLTLKLQERWAVSTNKALSCKLVNTCKAIDTAREYQCKVFDIETKAIKRKWKSVINRKVMQKFLLFPNSAVISYFNYTI